MPEKRGGLARHAPDLFSQGFVMPKKIGGFSRVPRAIRSIRLVEKSVVSEEMKPRRLDVELVERQLAESREKAQRLILAGEVWVEGQRWDKASKLCAATAAIEVRGGDRYVSRGGHKLEGALTGFPLDVKGWRCLDVGASTGGFTDCLLQHGAREVVALDVGHGQLHWRLRQDPRVIVHEGVNARDLSGLFNEKTPPFDLVVFDVSFISLRKVLPPAFDLLSSGGKICALIKPQFEAGRAEVGKGGIVRDEAVRAKVVRDLIQWSGDFPVMTVGTIPSPLPGRDGNEEFLWLLQKK
jgi:23S rRNA (cytidine1920-2'-O)/16S rRNA (cytidine1409-2'-O)-methyltransferase